MTQPSPTLCPPYVAECLRAYIEQGVPLGDFLQAVVEDRLVASFKAADQENLEAMPHIVAWLYWEMPTNLRGAANYAAHLHRMREIREGQATRPVDP